MPTFYSIIRIDYPSEEGRNYWSEVVQLIYEELGWAEAIDDYDLWFAAFAPGDFVFYFAVDTATQRPIGSITFGIYRNAIAGDLSVIGFYFVHPHHRGMSIGASLFRAMEADVLITSHRYLYGVSHMWEKYRDQGFIHIPGWKQLVETVDCGSISLERLLPHGSTVSIRDWDKVGWEELVNFDSQCAGGYRRDTYMRAIFDQRPSITKVAIQHEGGVVGYCRVRETLGNNLDVAPLYAKDLATAKALLHATLVEFAQNGGLAAYRSLYFKPPSTNEQAIQLLKLLMDKKKAELWLSSEGHACVPQYTMAPLNLLTGFVFSTNENDASFI